MSEPHTLEEYEDAKGLLDRARKIQEATLGPEHPDYAATLTNLANVHIHLESRDEAEALYRRALGIWEKSLSGAHPHKVSPLVGLATIAVERRQWDEAVSWAERAVSEGEAAESPAPDIADARFALAQALWGGEKDRRRAVALARDTVQVYRQAGAGYEAALDEVTTWLARRTREPK